MRTWRWTVAFSMLLLLLAAPLDAFARRSGGSFSGRGGFRSPSTSPSRSPSPGYRPGYNTGPNVFVVPGFGWGYGGLGGGMGMGSLLMFGMLGLAGFYAYRALRNASRRESGYHPGDDPDESAADFRPDRAYLYKVQLGLGRSARGLQNRLAHFAEQGDTGTETGLAALLSQTALELIREKDSIRYVQTSADGPMPLAKAETKMNGLSLAERSRFDVERVRAADGGVRKASETLADSEDVLEYIVVTLVVATREPLAEFGSVDEHVQLEPLLSALGGVSPRELLGLEVVWTPADPADALTENDLLTTYPNLRGL